MTTPLSQSSSEHGQSVEQLLLSFSEQVNERVLTIEPEEEAQFCVSYASELTEGNDVETRNERIEKRIYLYQRALRIWSKDSHPEKWAWVHPVLGKNFREKTSGDRRENIDECIKCYEQALEIYTR